MCLGSKKKPEVGLEAQPPVSMLQIQPALGAEPNSALIERIYSCKEMTKDLSIKKGDLIFSLEELKKVPKSNDKKKCRKSSKEEIRIRKRETDADNDTLYPKSLSTTETDKEQTEEMSSDALQYDPYAPLEELEKQECFNCHTLRRNTFLANTLSMPNEKERQIKSKPKLPHLPQTSIEATEKLSGKARSKNLLERSKTMKLEELASQNSVSGTFSKAKMLPSPIHEKETSRNNRELQ
uniref:SH3 domain-containing protein n=1 Tax=Elaeophora elaphi TaxID=1147741 RepID=A0A0R3RR42_9BILA